LSPIHDYYIYQLTAAKYNIPFKALPMLVCMKYSTRAVFFIHTCGSALTITYSMEDYYLSVALHDILRLLLSGPAPDYGLYPPFVVGYLLPEKMPPPVV